MSPSTRVKELGGAVVVSTADDARMPAPATTTAILLTTPGAAQQVAAQVPLVIDPSAPGRLRVSAPIDPRTLRAEIEDDVRSTLLALTGVALLASVVGLANAMILAVIERRQEIGLRRALGARARHIFGLVLTESAIIGLLGGVLGLAVGLCGVLGVTIAQHWSPVFDVALAPVALAGGIIVGIAGGLFAAGRAARIQPGEALRQ